MEARLRLYQPLRQNAAGARRQNVACHSSGKGLLTMPVIRTSQEAMHGGNRPAWSGVTSAGVFRVPTTGGKFDRHYHDCNEYWLVFRGKAKVLSEGVEFYVQPGDIV